MRTARTSRSSRAGDPPHGRSFDGTRFGGWRLTVQGRTRLQLQSACPGPRQGVRAEAYNFLEDQNLSVRVVAPPAGSNVADAACVVLDLERARFGRLEFVDDEDVFETPSGDAGPRAHLGGFPVVVPVERGGRESLGIGRCPEPRLRLHEDPGLRAFQVPDEPHLSPDQLASLPRLGVLAEMPDVSLLVLSEEDELRLDQLPSAEVAVPADHGAHA